MLVQTKQEQDDPTLTCGTQQLDKIPDDVTGFRVVWAICHSKLCSRAASNHKMPEFETTKQAWRSFLQPKQPAKQVDWLVGWRVHLQRWSTAPLLEIRGFLQQLYAISFLSLPISAQFLSSLNMKQADYLLLLARLTLPTEWSEVALGRTTSNRFICNSSLTTTFPFDAV